MLDRLTSMQAFIAVADRGSFAGAADELGISRAMVSKHVKALEAHLNVRLLNRTTRQLRLTDAGTDYLAQARLFLDQLEAFESALSNETQEIAGALNIAAPTSFGLIHVAPLTAAFMERYPQVKVKLMMADRNINLIEERIDVAITVRRLEHSSVIARKLADVRMEVVASERYLAAHGVPEDPRDLREHNCLVFDEFGAERSAQWGFGPEGDKLMVGVEGDLTANLGDVLRVAAVAGRGIARLPSYMVTEDVAAGRLVRLLSDYHPESKPVSVIYPHR